MADDFEIDISGLQETQKAIYDFSNKLGDRVTQMALRSGANFMLKQIRESAPKRTGRLRRALVVKNSRIHQRRRNGNVGVYITIRPGKNRNDPKGAYYGRFVESGYRRGKKQVAGRFFVKNTFNRLKEPSAQLIVKNIETAGQQLADKLK